MQTKMSVVVPEPAPQISVPNTGLFTWTGTGDSPASHLGLVLAIGAGILSLIILAIFIARFIKHRQRTSARKLYIKRPLALSLIPVFIVGAAVLAGASISEHNVKPAAAGPKTDIIVPDLDPLLAVSAEDVTIALEEGQTYGAATTEIMVAAADIPSHTLQLHVANSDLVNETNSDQAISGLGAAAPAPLANNTWGVSAFAPANEASPVWWSVPAGQENALVIRSNGNVRYYVEETTTLYYGVNIDPELPSVTYSNTLIYTAVPNGTGFSEFYDVDPTAGDITTISTMQEMSSSVCRATATPDASTVNVPEATLRDTRDNKTYTVRKLADGNCWMTDDLKLDANVTLTADNTDNPSITQLTSSNSWGTAIVATPYVNTTGSYGYWYNYYAATAGTASNDIAGSICPKNWTLPSDEQFDGILSTYRTYANGYGQQLIAPPFDMSYAGRWANNSAQSIGSYGFYWSNSYNSGLYGGGLLLENSYASTYSFEIQNGYTVRCVAR